MKLMLHFIQIIILSSVLEQKTVISLVPVTTVNLQIKQNKQTNKKVAKLRRFVSSSFNTSSEIEGEKGGRKKKNQAVLHRVFPHILLKGGSQNTSV